jgi:hypothetical protein
VPVSSVFSIPASAAEKALWDSTSFVVIVTSVIDRATIEETAVTIAAIVRRIKRRAWPFSFSLIYSLCNLGKV